jgi:gliding motility-associated lipoprotein GldH
MNLFLFLKTYYPNFEFSRDTLECFLSDETGRWFGRGGSSVKNCIWLFKGNVVFPQKGHYKFEFIHGMRTENLKNIMDLGMKIVPSN